MMAETATSQWTAGSNASTWCRCVEREANPASFLAPPLPNTPLGVANTSVRVPDTRLRVSATSAGVSHTPLGVSNPRMWLSNTCAVCPTLLCVCRTACSASIRSSDGSTWFQGWKRPSFAGLHMVKPPPALLADYSPVDMLCFWCEVVNFGVGNGHHSISASSSDASTCFQRWRLGLS